MASRWPIRSEHRSPAPVWISERKELDDDVPGFALVTRLHTRCLRGARAVGQQASIKCDTTDRRGSGGAGERGERRRLGGGVADLPGRSARMT
jgi:hypothetical protein